MATTSSGKIKKKTYCSQCFSILTWDSTQDEKNENGHIRIICPVCGWHEDISDNVQIIEQESN